MPTWVPNHSSFFVPEHKYNLEKWTQYVFLDWIMMIYWREENTLDLIYQHARNKDYLHCSKESKQIFLHHYILDWLKFICDEPS